MNRKRALLRFQAVRAVDLTKWRIAGRNIPPSALIALNNWLESDPDVPAGQWFKRFNGFILCGDGEFPKTFLLPNQHPFGPEVSCVAFSSRRGAGLQ
jgi:hypothetical protein